MAVPTRVLDSASAEAPNSHERGWARGSPAQCLWEPAGMPVMAETTCAEPLERSAQALRVALDRRALASTNCSLRTRLCSSASPTTAASIIRAMVARQAAPGGVA